MDAHTHRPQCFGYSHGPRDLNSHYFGCLKASERESFLSSLPARSQAQLHEEERRVTQLRSLLEIQQHTEEALLLRRHKQALSRWRKTSKSQKQAPAKPPVPVVPKAAAGAKVEVDDVDVFAHMMFFKDSGPHTLEDFLPEEFPNQKIPLKRLLYDGDPKRNPLTRDYPENMIRYFHVPGNDMKWVEELIACYYDDSLPVGPGQNPDHHDWMHENDNMRTNTRILLDHEVWRGQQRGPSINDPVHTRSMRPRCDLVATPSKTDGEQKSKNLVLFMPYLHWETYRARNEQARTIKSCDRGKRSISQKFSDIAKRTVDDLTGKRASKRKRRQWPFKYPKRQSQEYPDKSLRFPWEPKHPLGQLLLQAANLATGMSFYTDKILLQNRLDLNPPLHPRRTLDQYYYWALKDIEAQDKSQVVYRATAPTKHLPDQFAKRDLECRECLQDIRTVPRLLMVDQLWLWILDDNTIITFFPSRWGTTPSSTDTSDVHFRLRLRLSSSTSQIHSAYDLATLILDQCSGVFFSHSPTRSLRPQVLEIFAHAIGDVSFKQITSFNHFLEYTRLFSVAYKSRREKRSVVRHQNFLVDINTEVKLLQEIKDVGDELMIMTNVLREQQVVAKTFARHVQGILRAEEGWRGRKEGANGVNGLNGTMGREVGSAEQEAKRRIKSTISRSMELGKSIEERIAELQRLIDTATDVASALNDLLGLKQQQMGVVEARLEAREAVEQGRETVRQGRTIMLFTVVTIIFMPLSFVASVFGMNVAELNDGKLNIRQEFSYMFPISLGFSLVTLGIAFKIYMMP